MNKTIDMISSLPDDVLTHILSFMSTKEVVQSCILAKRWRNIWASVPVLDFKLDDFYKTNNGQEDDEQENECKWFVRFVNGVLENRGPSHVDRVIYDWSYDSFDDPSMNFLDRITLLMPRIIIAHIDSASSSLVPDSIFSCVSLQKLIMHLNYNDVCQIVLAPNSINLPSLKILELMWVNITENYVRNLFSGCPALESIKLDCCILHVPAISSGVLKMLTLHHCTPFESLRISCPSLVSLLIHNDIWENASISLQNMTSLVTADIEFLDFEYSLNLSTLNLLSGLSNATSLKLHIDTLESKEELEEDITNCITFRNLKSLEIEAWDMIDNFDLVACFLKNSPNLRELTLYLLNSHVDAREEPIQGVLEDKKFQIEYLETLKICGNPKCVGYMVKILRRFIKTVGNINHY